MISSFILFLLMLVVLLVVGIFWYLGRDLPNLVHLKHYHPWRITQIKGIDDSILMRLAHQRRTVIKYDEMPKHLIQAIIAAEDAHFFKHQGVAYSGILRAFWKNLWKSPNAPKQGGSTITQQVVKTFLLSPKQTYRRKIREAILAHRLEKYLTKKEILFLYLNQIYFGNQRYGVEEASLFYFGKKTKELCLNESAILASIPKNPERYNPAHSIKLTKKRRNYVLRMMLKNQFITREVYEKTLKEEVYPVPEYHIAPFTRDYYTEEVRRRAIKILTNILKQKILQKHKNFRQHFPKYLEKKLSIQAVNWLYRQGLQIKTAMNPQLQKEAIISLRRGLEKIDKKNGYRGVIKNIAEKNYPSLLKKLTILQTKLLPDKLYKALVLGKNAQGYTISLGQYKGILNYSSMKWAKKQAFKRGTQFIYHDIQPEKLFKNGDLIWVRLLNSTELIQQPTFRENETRQNGKFYRENFSLFALEQKPLIQGSIVVIDPKTHQVRALVGGYDFSKSSFNRATQALRQPGSAFKPIIYAAALQSTQYTTASLVSDAYLKLWIQGKNWIPKNYNSRYSNRLVSLRKALALSINTVAVRVLARIGIKKAILLARRLGITSPLSETLPLALGASAVKPIELTNVYATFAAQGAFDKAVLITHINDHDGKIIYERLPYLRRRMKRNTSYIMTSMLQSVVKNGTAKLALSLKRPIAGKTGTSNKSTNAWFIGYTRQFCTGVWIGYDDRTPIGNKASGGSTALPIFVNFMKKAHIRKDGKILTKEPFSIPDDVLFVKLDKEKKTLASPDNNSFYFEVFLPNTAPKIYEKDVNDEVNPADF